VGHLTAPRAALGATLVALLAELLSPSPLVAFYLVAVASAALIGAGFFAYLSAVDEPTSPRIAALALIGLAGGMVMAEAAMRFPQLLDARAPDGPGMLVLLAVVAAGVSLLSELPSLPGRLPRPAASALRELLSR